MLVIRVTFFLMNWVSLQFSRAGGWPQTTMSDAWHLGHCFVMGFGNSASGQAKPCAKTLLESLHSKHPVSLR